MVPTCGETAYSTLSEGAMVPFSLVSDLLFSSLPPFPFWYPLFPSPFPPWTSRPSASMEVVFLSTQPSPFLRAKPLPELEPRTSSMASPQVPLQPKQLCWIAGFSDLCLRHLLMTQGLERTRTLTENQVALSWEHRCKHHFKPSSLTP